MQCRRLEINLLSAYNLENVRNYFRMKVYAVVSIAGKPRTQNQTPVDYQGEENPSWNFTVKYTVAELGVLEEETSPNIVVKLYCKRTLGDRYIGEVQITMKELYDKGLENGSGSAILSYPVENGSGGKNQGVLNLWCKFGKATSVYQEPSFIKKVVVTGVMTGLRTSLRMFFKSRMGSYYAIGTTATFDENTIDWAP